MRIQSKLFGGYGEIPLGKTIARRRGGIRLLFFFFHRFFAAIRRKKAKAKDAPQREGYELEVSIPRVIIKTVGGIMETLGNRGAQLLDMIDSNDVSRLTYIAPSRGLLAFARHIKTS